MEKRCNAIVIGASAGGLNAVSQAIHDLTGALNAAVFVVIHSGPGSDSNLVSAILQKHTTLTCMVSSGDARFQDSHLYFALADHQMLLQDHHKRILRAAKENCWRPSMDTLFRSAAANGSLNVENRKTIGSVILKPNKI